MRAIFLVGLASLLLAGCGDSQPIETGELRSSAREPTPSSFVVQIRNACPEAVVLAVSPTPPGPATATATLRSTGVEVVTVEQGTRIWLRYDNDWDERRSVAPTGDEVIEVSFQCDSIYGRPGRL
jgi:hypothetical protein